MSASTSAGPARPPAIEAPTPRRLAVAWQHPVSRSIQPVGLLSDLGDRFEFCYVNNASALRDFLPFVGFSDLHRVYSSQRLFPLFAQRVMDRRRPDYPLFVRTLDLTPEATPWEQLTRSEGRRSGDTIILFPEPVVDDAGRSICNFFVHGIRHMIRNHPEVEETLGVLGRGDELRMVGEPDNPKNSHALLTSAVAADCPLGWVPDILLDYAHAIRNSGDHRLEVVQVNGPEVPIHQRLLVRLEGRVEPGFTAFSGEKWLPINRGGK